MFDSIVEAIFHHAEVQPDRLCLADDDGAVTYREFAELIARYAGLAARMGIPAGDRVVVEACQTIDYLAIEMALQLRGIVFVPVEHNCAAAKIDGFVQRAEAAAVITCRPGDYGAPRSFTFDALKAGLADVEPGAPEAFPARETVCEILFSTGTTGREKGIVINHGNNIALAGNVIDGVRMEPDNVEMIPSPMNHSHGLRRFYANMYNGSTVVLLGSAMNLKRFMANLDAYGVTSMDLVPAALSVVLRLSRGKLAEYGDQLRYIQFGAAPMIEADQNEICRLLPHTRLYNFYGSTESGCTVIYNFNRPDVKKRCIGRPTRNVKAYIVDEARRPIESSESRTGLLCCAGGMNMVGYWRDDEETARVLKDGVVYSNDEAYFDADGDIILLGRKGDVINVGGNKVSPDEIEDAAKRIPGVADCGVIPVEEPGLGQAPKLYVQLQGGCAFDPVAIRAFLAKSLEPYKVPAYIEQIDRIPRSFNGKLLRKELERVSKAGTAQ